MTVDARYLHWLTIAVALLTVAYIGFVVSGGTLGGEGQHYVAESVEWCQANGGELHNARAMWHSGLHCKLPNGTSVHMIDVVGGE